MKTILTATVSDLNNIENVYTSIYSPDVAKRPVGWPTPLTVRHVVPGSPTVRYTFTPNFRKDYVDVEYETEGSAVLVSGVVQKFTFRFHGANDMSRRADPIIKRPADPHIDQFMRRCDESRGQGTSPYRFIQIVYFICSTVIAYFQEGFRVQSESDTEKILLPRPDMFEVVSAEERRRHIEHMCDGWDYVSLSQEEARQLHWYVYTEKRDVTGFLPRSLSELPLTSFAARIEDEENPECTYVMYYTANGDILHVTICVEAIKSVLRIDKLDFDLKVCSEIVDGAQKYQYELVDGLEKGFVQWLTEKDVLFAIGEEEISPLEQAIRTFFLIEDFLRIPRSELLLDVEEKECSGSKSSCVRASGTGSGGETSNGKRVVRFFKKYTLKKDFSLSQRKHHVFTCPAWGVKGHYRHLKDGRSVFVKAHVKGKQKSAYAGKEYLVRSPL